jgi:sugar lactone lactonase YvrE
MGSRSTSMSRVTAVEAIEPVPFIDGIVYGEGPRWHNDRLWFSDGPAGRVCSVGETGDVAVEAEVEHASGLGWLPDGTLVVSALLEPKIYHVDAQGQVAATYDLSDLAWSTNDLCVAPDGRGYVDLYGGQASARGLKARSASSTPSGVGEAVSVGGSATSAKHTSTGAHTHRGTSTEQRLAQRLNTQRTDDPHSTH